MNPTYWARWSVCTVAALFFSFAAASPALAQKKARPGVGTPKAGDAAPLKQKLQEIGAKLNTIQQAVMKENKKLAKQETGLRGMIQKVIKKSGLDIDAEMKAMKALYGKLTAGKMSKEEGAKVFKEFQAKRQALQKAQYMAMQDPKVKKASEAFQKAMEAAMIKKAPVAKELIKQYKELTAKAMGMAAPPR